MATLLQQLPALIGVIIGGVVTYTLTTAAERARWRRDQHVRWDTARMQAYAEYGDAVKRVIHMASRLAAERGIAMAAPPMPVHQGLPELDQAIAERTARWESILLLGDPATIIAARTWHQCVWELEYFARGQLTDPEEWNLARAECDQARHEFYRCARLGLGIGGVVPDVTWIPPWRARVGNQLDGKPAPTNVGAEIPTE